MERIPGFSEEHEQQSRVEPEDLVVKPYLREDETAVFVSGPGFYEGGDDAPNFVGIVREAIEAARQNNGELPTIDLSDDDEVRALIRDRASRL